MRGKRLLSFLVPAGTLQEGKRSPSVDFVRLKKDRPPEEKKRERPDRKPPEQPPPPPEMNYAKNMNPDDAVGAIVPMVDANVERARATNLGAGGADRDVVPMVPGIDVRLEFALKR